MAKKGAAVLGRGKKGRRKCLGSPQMSDFAQDQGSRLTGATDPGGRGWYYLAAGGRKDAQRKGDTAFLVTAVRWGRQAGGQGSPTGRGQGRDTTLKGQAYFA